LSLNVSRLSLYQDRLWDSMVMIYGSRLSLLDCGVKKRVKQYSRVNIFDS
jgi:hypothetical protein